MTYIAFALKLLKEAKVHDLRAEQHALTIDTTRVQTCKSEMSYVRFATNQCKTSRDVMHFSQRSAADRARLAILEAVCQHSLICSEAVLV